MFGNRQFTQALQRFKDMMAYALQEKQKQKTIDNLLGSLSPAEKA
jgi:hypothetical protein